MPDSGTPITPNSFHRTELHASGEGDVTKIIINIPMAMLMTFRKAFHFSNGCKGHYKDKESQRDALIQ